MEALLSKGGNISRKNVLKRESYQVAKPKQYKRHPIH